MPLEKRNLASTNQNKMGDRHSKEASKNNLKARKDGKKKAGRQTDPDPQSEWHIVPTGGTTLGITSSIIHASIDPDAGTQQGRHGVCQRGKQDDHVLMTECLQDLLVRALTRIKGLGMLRCTGNIEIGQFISIHIRLAILGGQVFELLTSRGDMLDSIHYMPIGKKNQGECQQSHRTRQGRNQLGRFVKIRNCRSQHFLFQKCGRHHIDGGSEQNLGDGGHDDVPVDLQVPPLFEGKMNECDGCSVIAAFGCSKEFRIFWIFFPCFLFVSCCFFHFLCFSICSWPAHLFDRSATNNK
mmetsp:Transcript_6524/g.14836  ORF Transcript_6524/g.14836 Transcript_6524/m.14836 type:complete len:297 (+) Transcript_6524:108-998(+)